MPYTVENFAEKTNEARMTHLTNLAIQKKHPYFKDLKNQATLAVDELIDYLVSNGIISSAEEYTEKVDSKINEIMRLMFLQMKEKLDRKFGCFEIFGFDFMLDSQLNPYLLEVNINPAMFLDTKVLE
jgi:D-alanine-D-alanine ligase-like ATP-grasp enzyme